MDVELKACACNPGRYFGSLGFFFTDTPTMVRT